MTVGELLAALRGPNHMDSRVRGKYVAIEKVELRGYEEYVDDDGTPRVRHGSGTVVSYHLFGGGAVYTYKTLRGARKAAGNGGFVCVLDLSMLPIIDLDAVAAGVDDKNEIDEYSLAERQLEAWANRVRDLKAKQSK